MRPISQYVIGAAISFPLFLGACAIGPRVGAPAKDDLAAMARGEKAIVLFRHSMTRDGEAYDDAGARMFTYANIDKGEAPPLSVGLSTPSEKAQGEGWLYAVMSPGTYFFLVYPPGLRQNPPAAALHVDSGTYGRLANRELKVRRGAFWYGAMQRFLIQGEQPADFKPVRGFLLQVPEGGKVVYGGSISVACGSIPGILGRLTDACGPFRIADESAKARRVAARAFGPARPFVTAMMTPYGRRMASPARERLGSPRLDVRIHGGARGGVSGARAAPIFLLPGSGVGTVGSAQVFGVFNILSLLAHSASAAAVEQEAKARQEKWSPCFKRLASAITPADMVAGLRTALEAALRADGAGAEPKGPTALPKALRATWLGSGLRECIAKGTFCVEIAVRVRLEEDAAGVSPYDSILVYSNSYRSDPLKTTSRLYENVVAPFSTCRSIEGYCGDEGLDLVRREISDGVRHIAARLAADLRGVK